MSEIKKNNLNIEEMVAAGLHFGHRTSKIHPKMKPYLFGVKNGIHLIDVDKTLEKLQEALTFIEQLIKEDKVLLLVGTKVQTKDLVRAMAEECGIPYVADRWLGGTFTNFGTIKKRIDHFKDLENKKAAGELEKYTKKERLNIDKELKILTTKVGGIKDLNGLPEAVFILDMHKNKLAVKEARDMGVKIIALTDTNCNPDLVDYPIPANNDAVSAVSYILDRIKETILKVKPKVK